MEFKTIEDRMLYYRSLTNYKLPAKSYVIAMLDGKSFSKYTNDLIKPFDEGFIEDMNETAKYLCENVSGCEFAFVQSDEISLFICDYKTTKTQAWFDYRLNKLHSISASMAATKFNQLRLVRELRENNKINEDTSSIIDNIIETKLAQFDSKFWTVPNKNDVYAWFMYRQRDCVRNSISMTAQTYFSHTQLHKKSDNEMQEMLFTEKGINWNNYPIGQKRGRLVLKKQFLYDKDGVCLGVYEENGVELADNNHIRSKWIVEDAPNFNTEEDKDFLLSYIPLNEPVL